MESYLFRSFANILIRLHFLLLPFLPVLNESVQGNYLISVLSLGVCVCLGGGSVRMADNCFFFFFLVSQVIRSRRTILKLLH